MVREDYRPVVARLTPRAKEAWEVLARGHGGDVTSWLEAIGRELASAHDPLDVFRRDLRAELRRQATTIASERRRRTKGG